MRLCDYFIWQSQLEDLDLASNVIRELDRFVRAVSLLLLLFFPPHSDNVALLSGHSDIGKLSMLKKLSLRHNLIKVGDKVHFA